MIKSSKRLIAMLICLAMVLSMLPMAAFAAGTKTVYFNNGVWTNVNVYYWGGTSTAPQWPGIAMTDMGNGYFTYDVPDDITGIIFNNGSAKTVDLTLPTGEENCHDGKNWSVYTGAAVEVEMATVYVDATACGWSNVNAYYWGGTSGCEWPGTAMTSIGNGVYSIEISADTTFIIFNNGSGSQTDNLTFPGDGYIWNGSEFVDYATYTPVGGEVEVDNNWYLRGTMNEWGKTLMTDNGDGTWSVTLSLEAGEYLYKAAKNDWAESIGDPNSGNADGNAVLNLTVAADVTFTVNPGNGTIAATYETDCTHSNITVLPEVAATCTTAGKTKGEVCADCGFVIKAQEDVAALGHTVVDGACSVCGEMAEYITVYFQNNWMWSDVKIYTFGSGFEADAEWPGVAMELYGNDGNYDIYSAVIPADAKIVINGTKDDGSGATDQTPNITDAVDGICYYMTWSDGNAVGSENIEVILPSEPECEHEYTYECDVQCNKCYEITREASHSVVYVEAVEATCYENGNVEYWYCEYCGVAWLDEAQTQQTNLKSVVVPMAHAEATHVEAKDATCTEMGNIEYWYCEACGQAWLDADCTLNTNLMAVKLPMADHEYMYPCDGFCMNCYELTNPDAAHSLTHVEAKPATDCQSWDGNIEYWSCEYCGGYWDNENATGMPLNRFSVITTGEHVYENGMCTTCDSSEYGIKYQTKVDENGNHLRLITALSGIENFASVSFTITIGEETVEKTVTNAYTSLIASGSTKTASDLFGEDATHLVLLTIENITNTTDEMMIVATWTSVDGETHTSDARFISLAELFA